MVIKMIFKDRIDAGRKLAKKLSKYKNKKNTIVLGIPRGGVEIAFEVSRILKLPLDIVVTKKISHPNESEFAIGAVSPGNYIVDEFQDKELKDDYIKKTVRELNKEIKRRYKEYTSGKMPILKDKIVIIVDDGLATGFTMMAAIKYVKSKNPKKVIVAVPVAAKDSFQKTKDLADEVICLDIPPFFTAVGTFYQDFQQLEDNEVRFYIKEAKKN